MHVIVTHDNADFDAIAALLGAHKLYQGAVAMIPHRLNRNVHDFLHLYWEEFPFIYPQELPKKSISRITVVDSQHIPTLPGIKDDIQIQIIDHHTLDADLPPTALVTVQEVGACTTLLVEQMKQQHLEPNANEATLLLLGIYEDTGSLTYANTTSRDVYAAAWLLEQKASLEVIRQFLHYPLDQEQRVLYQQLTDAMETHQIEGHTIVICMARAEGYVEEISSLAHRLRALLEPDALFLLVAMEDHIQVVARSSSQDIDVGEITVQLGGGGHSRAAAAVVRHTDLSLLHAQLLALLQRDVRPAATVAGIMSYGVHSLAPDDSVARAAEMMARYGHEGFPVVSGDRIVGVLTRREIDKAMHHGLEGSAIRQFMRKGDFYVSPEDSVEKLQALMTQEGLGQVPVVEDGRVIGIVTRTDLISLWSEVPRPSRSGEIAERLRQIFPAKLLELLQEAGRIAAQQEASLFIVGGFVRDLLHQPDMGLTPYPDIDLVVEGDAIALARQLCQRYGGEVRSHRRFGTAKWLIDPDGPGWQLPNQEASAQSNHLPASLDFVTARMEFYEHPSALPEVERSSIKQDLHRRDFTINTLAIDLTPDHYGELLDFYGGEADLKQGHIRVLHSLSFVEDPTRILRAVRLEQRMGFEIEPRTAELLHDALDLLDRVSGERIHHELVLIFREPAPEPALQRLNQLGILHQIQPALIVDDWIIERLVTLRTGLRNTPWADMPIEEVHYWGVLTCRLPETATRKLVTRLRIRGADAAILHQIKMLWQHIAPQLHQPLPPSRIYRYLSPLAPEALLIGWLTVDDTTARAQIAQFQRELRGMETIIDGHYLHHELGLEPGPVYRKILDDLLAARLDGKVVTMADEKAWVSQWAATHELPRRKKKKGPAE